MKGAFKFPMVKVESGGEAPDPAVYCPAHGYTQPPEVPWVSPVVTPEPNDQQILLVCSDFYEGGLAIRTRITTGFTKVEILNSNMSVISTFNGGISNGTLGTINIDFPTIDTGAIYIIRLSPVNSGVSFLEFRTTTRAGFIGNWMILEAKFKTPNMEKLEYAFDGLDAFKVCHFYSTMNALTTMFYAFSRTSIEKIEGIKQFASLTNMNYAFFGATCKFWDFTDWYSPNAVLSRTFMSSQVEKVIFSENCGFISEYTFASTPIKLIVAPNDTLKATGTYFRYTFQNTPNFEGTDAVNKSIKIDIWNSTVSIERIFDQSPKIKKIEFIGTADLLNVLTYSFNGAKSLEELILPSSMNAMTVWNNTIAGCIRLKKIVLPLSMASWNAGWTNAAIPNGNALEELTTCNVYADAQPTIWLYGNKWKKFIQPTLKGSRFIIGNSAADRCLNLFGDIDIDFENSSFTQTTPAVAIYANFTTAALNAIYARLPDFTGDTQRRIMVSSNPGYAASNTAILVAKNWQAQ